MAEKHMKLRIIMTNATGSLIRIHIKRNAFLLKIPKTLVRIKHGINLIQKEINFCKRNENFFIPKRSELFHVFMPESGHVLSFYLLRPEIQQT